MVAAEEAHPEDGCSWLHGEGELWLCLKEKSREERNKLFGLEMVGVRYNEVGSAADPWGQELHPEESWARTLAGYAGV